MCVCAGVDRITVGTQGTYTVSCKPRNLISKNRKIQLSLFVSSLQMFVFRLTFSSHSGRHTAPHRQLTCRGLEHQWAQHIWNQASLPWPDRISWRPESALNPVNLHLHGVIPDPLTLPFHPTASLLEMQWLRAVTSQMLSSREISPQSEEKFGFLQIQNQNINMLVSRKFFS